MAMLDAAPAVRRIDTDRTDLLAVDIVGRVSSADAENLYGLLEAAYALHPSIDVLVRFVDHGGVDWEEVDKTTLEEGRTRARDHVRRCASIGEPDWISGIQGWFTKSEPVELKHFAADEEEQAWAWLNARPEAEA